MEARTFENASAMPAPTWYFLRMNDTTIEVAADLEPASDVDIEVDGVTLAETGAFDEALAAAQTAFDEVATPYLLNYGDEAAEELGGLALSEYQRALDAVETTRNLAESFEAGTGKDVSSWLAETAGQACALVAEEGVNASCALRILGIDGAANVASADIVAKDGANLVVTVMVDSPNEGTGLVGTTLRVFAGAGAHVRIQRVQTLDDSWTDIDDMGLFLDKDAVIEINQTVLGAGKSYTGLAGDLRGDGSDANVVARYLGHGEQELDFNYVLRHHGKKTTCNLYTNGVLAGTSVKTLRGTIDLIRGCKGAEGTETDNVLLVDKGVHNRTVPTILCNEDDVAGNHGATIGHIGSEQLFYLASRGLSQEEAEDMFVSAQLEDAYLNAPDDACAAAVMRLGSKLIENFEEVVA